LAVINAGIEGARAVTHHYPTAAFDAVVAVNLRGSWLCLKHLMPLLLAAREGGGDPAVVVTSSTAGE
jgi:NAD(P)-dependent dehydrogenase (short-subunit alcohol dehydrogenase family)